MILYLSIDAFDRTLSNFMEIYLRFVDTQRTNASSKSSNMPSVQEYENPSARSNFFLFIRNDLTALRETISAIERQGFDLTEITNASFQYLFLKYLHPVA